jgi:hypothetical protein
MVPPCLLSVVRMSSGTSSSLVSRERCRAGGMGTCWRKLVYGTAAYMDACSGCWMVKVGVHQSGITLVCTCLGGAVSCCGLGRGHCNYDRGKHLRASPGVWL